MATQSAEGETPDLERANIEDEIPDLERSNIEDETRDDPWQFPEEDENTPFTDETPRDFVILRGRRELYDQLMWQIPSLSLTGESFLFLISLGAGISDIARIIASVVGVVVGFSSVYSLGLLKACERYDSMALTVRLNEKYKNKIGKYPVLGKEFHRSRARYYASTCCGSKRDHQHHHHHNRHKCATFLAYNFDTFPPSRIRTLCFFCLIFANVIILILSSIQLTTGDNRYFK
jgi:hypothetical protein